METNIIVDVYKVTRVTTTYFTNVANAKKFARQQFKDAGVYKVKVWKEIRVANIVNPPSLILQLV